MVKQNRHQPVTQSTAQCNTGPDRSVSEHAINLTLLAMELRRRHPTCIPLLTKPHRQLH